MSNYAYPPSLQELISYLTLLPGVGPKTAQRLALHILHMPESNAAGLANAITNARAKVRHCRICGNLTDEECCPICQDSQRDATTLCVVEQPGDCIVVEKTGLYHGLYHVLHGALSPMAGIGPDNLNIASLLQRLQEPVVQEVIMATNTGVEGEATALYLAKRIKALPRPVRISRLAYGIAVGGDLEYTDEATLGRALQGRLSI